MVIARASLGELLDSLDEAVTKGYVNAAQFEELDQAVRAAMATANGLRRYLQNTPTPREHLARPLKPLRK